MNEIDEYLDDNYFNSLTDDQSLSEIYNYDNNIELKNEELKDKKNKKTKVKRFANFEGPFQKYDKEIEEKAVFETYRLYKNQGPQMTKKDFLFLAESSKEVNEEIKKNRNMLVETKIKRHVLDKIRENIDYEKIEMYKAKISKINKNKVLYGILSFLFMFFILAAGAVHQTLNKLVFKKDFDYISMGIFIGTFVIIFISQFVFFSLIKQKTKKMTFWVQEHVAHALLDNSISWISLKKYAFETLVDFDYVSTSSSKYWLNRMRYPDVPHNKIIKTPDYSHNYTYRNMLINIQDAYLDNHNEMYSSVDLDKIKIDDREVIQPNIKDDTLFIRVIELDLKNTKFGKYEIPDFNIFNFLNISKETAPKNLKVVKKLDTGFDTTFNLFSNVSEHKKSVLFNALTTFMNDKYFAKDYSLVNSSISCFDKKLVAILGYDNNQDNKAINWQTLSIENWHDYFAKSPNIATLFNKNNSSLKSTETLEQIKTNETMFFHDDNENTQISYLDLMIYLDAFSKFFAYIHTHVEISLFPLVKLIALLIHEENKQSI